jgi:hypothetical protein
MLEVVRLLVNKSQQNVSKRLDEQLSRKLASSLPCGDYIPMVCRELPEEDMYGTDL